MIEVETVVVGGGPGGSSCARVLRRAGHDVLVLDSASFPRSKLCAGWITPKVLTDLELNPDLVPSLEPIPTFRIHWKHYRPSIDPPAGQFSVRRIVFDAFLLERSAARVERHRVKSIERKGQSFIVDGRYRCRNLVGAGGTHCPVRRALFPELLKTGELALAQELEFESVGPIVKETHLWWRYPYNPGFAWFVPKLDAVNIGFGYFKQSTCASRKPWEAFRELLCDAGLLSELDQPRPKGWSYYLRGESGLPIKKQGLFLVGDAAGLASRDLGEGIGQAVESGIACAREILGGQPFSVDEVTRYSMYGGRVLGRMLSPLF